MLRTTANAMAKVNTERQFFFIFTLQLRFTVEHRNTLAPTRHTEPFSGYASVTAVTGRCICNDLPRLGRHPGLIQTNPSRLFKMRLDFFEGLPFRFRQEERGRDQVEDGAGGEAKEHG